MKFLRSVILLVLFLGARESFSQVTCDYIALPTGPRCTPYFILDSAINTSSSAIVERRWYLTRAGSPVIAFDNGQLYPTFQFLANVAGNYCLRLWTRNANGDTCSITKCIDIANRPVSSFTFSPTEGCPGL